MALPRELIGVDQLKKHTPIIQEESIIGCKGCTWRAFTFRPDWLEFVDHLPRIDSAELVLTESDISQLNAIDKAFRK